MPDPPQSSPRSASHSGADPQTASWEFVLLTAFNAAGDMAELARAIAAAAVHPDGLAADVAHILRWEPLTDVFDRVARIVTPGESVSLTRWIESARLRGADALSPGPTPAPAAWDLEALDATTQQSWRVGTAAWGEASAPGVPWAASAGHAVIPIRAGGIEHGVVVAEFRCEEPAAQARAVRFAEVARMAIELRDHAEQLERRRGQALALLDLSTAARSSRNLAEVLHLASRLAAECAGADAAAIWVVGADHEPTLQLSHGPAGARERHGRAMLPVVRAAIESARPRTAFPATDELLLPTEAAAEIAAFAIWPVEAYGRTIAALGVWTVHGGARRLTLGRADREYLGAAANLVGLALEQARRFSELRDAERRGRDATRYARRRESLASLGELATRAGEEVMNPVASVRAFASRLQRELPEDGAPREYAEVILREVGRVERILSEQRTHAEMKPPAMAMVQLNTIADEALRACGDALVRRRARVVKRLAADLPELLLDPDSIGGVVRSVVDFALDSIATGGRIRIETRRLPQHVLFELGHDGTHDRGEALEQLFLPFGSTRPAGSSTGLSLARRVIQEHGGEIRVRSEGEWTTLVTFTLPIRGNQDRRNARADRRASRDGAGPPAAA